MFDQIFKVQNSFLTSSYVENWEFYLFLFLKFFESSHSAIIFGKVRNFWVAQKKNAQSSSCFEHFLSKRPNQEEDFFKFCVLLRKSELYKILVFWQYSYLYTASAYHQYLLEETPNWNKKFSIGILKLSKKNVLPFFASCCCGGFEVVIHFGTPGGSLQGSPHYLGSNRGCIYINIRLGFFD